MHAPDQKDVGRAGAAATSDSATAVDEIRSLEAKLLGMKKELLFSAAAVDDGADSLSLGFLVVRVGDEQFAAPISQVVEVVELPALTPLGDTVRTIAGLCNYHGQVLAVVDVAELSGRPRSPVSVDRVLVVCAVEPRTFALMVDEALEVVTADPGAVTLADEVMSGVMRSAGVLRLAGNATAQIIDLAWIAVGAQLAALLSADAATPAQERGA